MNHHDSSIFPIIIPIWIIWIIWIIWYENPIIIPSIFNLFFQIYGIVWIFNHNAPSVALKKTSGHNAPPAHGESRKMPRRRRFWVEALARGMLGKSWESPLEMGKLWWIYGESMVNLWLIMVNNGESMDNIWHIMGITSRNGGFSMFCSVDW